MPSNDFKSLAVHKDSDFYLNVSLVRQELRCSYNDAVNSIYRQLKEDAKELEIELEDAKEQLEARPRILKEKFAQVEELNKKLFEAEAERAAAEYARVELEKKLAEAEKKLESQKLLETKLVAIQAIIDLITR